MRIGLLILLWVLPLIAASQGRSGRPEIVGQSEISIDEDESVTIRLTDLRVRDRDDWWYPWGFSLQLYEGANYTFNNHTVTPNKDFNGTLRVPVTVNDGEHDSKRFDLQITVRSINDAPVITSQSDISTPEDKSVELKLSDLEIDDPDDDDFTMNISTGENYDVSGSTITPAPDFHGVLSIPVAVHDGEAESNTYTFKLQVTPVNDKPVITAQQQLQTDENKPITIKLEHLTVTDPDDSYPADFKLVIFSSGNAYTVSGNQVTPAMNFEGTLNVSVAVNDGDTNSDPFNLKITVLPGNNAPVIVGQSPVEMNEDESFKIEFSHLNVTDTDNTYPNGFQIKILEGQNYSARENNIITPGADYSGMLTVNIRVNDGNGDSETFGFKITVKEINDAPRLTDIETTALEFDPKDEQFQITSTLVIRDPDNINLTSAEIFLDPRNYRPGSDELNVDSDDNMITSSFDLSRGVLTLSGIAPIAEYQDLIRSATYTYRTGAFETKRILFRVHDGTDWSETAERSITGPDYVVDLDIPTAFTPNGDNANDTWNIRPIKQSAELNHAVVRVYSKSGSLLFETVGFEREWDGRSNGVLLPADSYFYTIDFNVNYLKKTFKGIVTILR